MRTLCILGVGATLLLAMEIGYSLQIQRYQTWSPADKQPQPAFFSGPITATLKAVMEGGSGAAPALGRKI